MKSRIIIIVLSLTCWQIGELNALAFYFGESGPPGTDDVHIGKTAIVMPLGRILLVGKNSEYCAIKFTKYWTGRTGEDHFAKYESYCQGDKSGNFIKKNVILKRGELSFPKPRGIGRFAFSLANREIECGIARLLWSGQGAVHFYNKKQKQGDYGIELAPTKWTDISHVDVFDPRLRWYKYDEKRRRENIPVDNLWKEITDRSGNP
jgi:hypothetical protein